MSFAKNFLFFLLYILSISCFITFSNAATNFNITNRCSYTVWAAASPGGGRRLDSGQSWQINVESGTVRIWGRTNCSFDGNGRGQCETGDCNGLLECQGFGRAPNTLAEFALNQPNNIDFFDISLVDGFNIPLEFSPTNNMCSSVRCTGPINEQCPAELRAPGGCNNPCTVFGTNEYCCNNGPATCGPTTYSRFFKERCPDAYINGGETSTTSTLNCPAGTNYRVVFCP